MTAEVMVRATIEEIVAHRDKAVALYEDAFVKIQEADDALRAARAEAMHAHPGVAENPYRSTDAEEIHAFMNAINLPDQDQYLRTARRLIDMDVWSYVIQRTELEHLMDKEAKDELRAQMSFVPERVDGDGVLINQDEIDQGLPPVTVDTVEATLKHFMASAGEIFQRGIANAFSKLDRRFKSHDGFGIKDRVILTNAFSEWGGWNYHRAHRDSLIDIERVFLVMDGKDPRATYAGIVGVIDEERKGMHSSGVQSVHEGDYFRVRIFKNGNAHLWFTRKDLVVKVNKLLADYYGEVIGYGSGGPEHVTEEDVFESKALTPAKQWGFFPTPASLVDKILENAPMHRSYEDRHKRLRILEPSAGTGNISSRLATPIDAGEGWGDDRKEYSYRPVVDVVEIQPHLAKELEESGVYARVTNADFLAVAPDPVYDLVVMNPPFDRERDIDHVTHAWKFLKPGGTLIAIMSAGTEWRQTKKAKAFQKMVETHSRGGWGRPWHDCPEGSFKEAGTNVNTVWIQLRKPEETE